MESVPSRTEASVVSLSTETTPTGSFPSTSSISEKLSSALPCNNSGNSSSSLELAHPVDELSEFSCAVLDVIANLSSLYGNSDICSPIGVTMLLSTELTQLLLVVSLS